MCSESQTLLQEPPQERPRKRRKRDGISPEETKNRLTATATSRASDGEVGRPASGVAKRRFILSSILTAFFLLLVFTALPGGGLCSQHQQPLIEAKDRNHRNSQRYRNHTDAYVLKVLNLNTWGLNWPFSQDRSHRIRSLREIIALSDYDIILLQEVWFRKDYEIIRKATPYMSYFESFNTCSGYFLPIECSGLVILSRHPIESVEFRPFSQRGSFWNFDGEIFVNKGVGRARVRWKGLSVDVFTSHLISLSMNPKNPNDHYRFKQSIESVRFIRESDADIKIFGGDMNALPYEDRNQPYAVFRSAMKDALLDRYPGASFHPWFATFGNLRNTYTGSAESAERIDYLMFWSRPGLEMWTKEFIMPMFMTKNGRKRLISLSDHEALHAEFLVRRTDGYGGGNKAVKATKRQFWQSKRRRRKK